MSSNNGKKTMNKKMYYNRDLSENELREIVNQVTYCHVCHTVDHDIETSDFAHCDICWMVTCPKPSCIAVWNKVNDEHCQHTNYWVHVGLPENAEM